MCDSADNKTVHCPNEKGKGAEPEEKPQEPKPNTTISPKPETTRREFWVFNYPGPSNADMTTRKRRQAAGLESQAPWNSHTESLGIIQTLLALHIATAVSHASSAAAPSTSTTSSLHSFSFVCALISSFLYVWCTIPCIISDTALPPIS